MLPKLLILSLLLLRVACFFGRPMPTLAKNRLEYEQSKRPFEDKATVLAHIYYQDDPYGISFAEALDFAHEMIAMEQSYGHPVLAYKYDCAKRWDPPKWLVAMCKAMATL